MFVTVDFASFINEVSCILSLRRRPSSSLGCAELGERVKDGPTDAYSHWSPSSKENECTGLALVLETFYSWLSLIHESSGSRSGEHRTVMGNKRVQSLPDLYCVVANGLAWSFHNSLR